jgi:ankyrin repeat protein
MDRTPLGKACWNGQVDVVEVLMKHKDIDINYKDSNMRTALHNCCWGPYGGRLKVKSSYNPSDSPECA